MLKAVIDTNVIVSLFIKRTFPSQYLLDSLKANKYTLIISYAILCEIISVLSRPNILKFTKMTKKEIKDLSLLLVEGSLIVEPKAKTAICRDADDDKFIRAAVSGKAAYIVSGDKDLLVLKKYKNIQIISLAEFRRLI